MAEAAADELLAATDLADMLVGLGVPFRQAHGIIASLVRTALERDRQLSELTEAELAEHSELLAAHSTQVREALALRSTLESKVSEGATSSARLKQQLELARGELGGG